MTYSQILVAHPQRDHETPKNASQKKGPIPAHINVLGLSSVESRAERKVVLQVSGGPEKRIVQIPLAELAVSDLKRLANLLAETGDVNLLDRKALQSLAKALLSEAAQKDITVLNGVGIQRVTFNNRTYQAYVWNGTAYWLGEVPPDSTFVIGDSPSAQTAGTHDDWVQRIGSKMPGNHYLIMLVTHTLASVLRRPFDQPRTAFIIVGPSGVGKTSIARCGQSTIGSCDEVKTMTGTPVGIREHLQTKPDCPVFYQDTRQFPVSELSNLLFDVHDGASRFKSGSSGVPLSSTLILTNERLIVEMSGAGKLALDEGLFARCVEIGCDAPYGAFHNIHGAESPAQFAKQLENDTGQYYGATWEYWLTMLSANWDFVVKKFDTWLPRVKSKLVERLGDACHKRVNNRILDGMAFSAWVGVIASHFGVLPLTKNEVIDSFAVVLAEVFARQSEGTTPLAKQIIATLKGLIDENPYRFPDFRTLQDRSSPTSVYGYRYTTKKDGELFLFLPSVFAREFVEKYGGNVFKMLAESGYLVTNKGRGNQVLVRVPGSEKNERRSFIAIRATIRFCSS